MHLSERVSLMFLRLLITITFCLIVPLWGEVKDNKHLNEPKIVSVLPLGGQQGSSFEIKVKGKALKGCHTVWFENKEVTGSIERLEVIENKPAKTKDPLAQYGLETVHPDHVAFIKITVSKDASLGLHLFRLLTPVGISNALALQIVTEPIIIETNNPHESAAKAQPLLLPAVVNGILFKKGEQDFYSFEAPVGSEILFEVQSDQGIKSGYHAEASVTLYKKSGSWFDPEKLVRLEIDGPSLSWEPIHKYKRISSAARWTLFRRFTHRFTSKGPHILSVQTFLGNGDPDHGYQLRIVPLEKSHYSWVLGKLAHPAPGDWLERNSATMRQLGSFKRPIKPNHLSVLYSRSGLTKQDVDNELSKIASDLKDKKGQPSRFSLSNLPIPVAETKSNDTVENSQRIIIPSLIEGCIDQVGDVDYFYFRVDTGQKLAFEIETPKKYPPQFNPWLRVYDIKGKLLIENIYKEYGGDGDDVMKTLERKTIYTFDKAGDYYVRIQDLSSRLGGPDYSYRILVRSQIPHLGRIELSLGVTSVLSSLIEKANHINLVPGQGQEIVLVCEKEEGFQGEVAFYLDGLPSGVQAWLSSPANWTESLLRGIQYRPLNTEVMPPIHHRPERNAITLFLWASPDAPATNHPKFLKLMARPLVKGKIGPAIIAGRLPFILIRQNRPVAVLNPNN